MTPTINEFDPRVIPFQLQVLKDIQEYDYGEGTHEVLLSGSVGSSKSVLLSHICVLLCLMHKNCHIGIGRLSMPALKGTLFRTIVDHIGDAVEVKVVDNTAKIFFPNGSRITSFSWQDKKYKKVRSHEFSVFAIEELTENDTDEAYKEILMRIGRDPKIKHKLLISATNPDEPSHWAYERFFTEKHDRRHVYLSKTADNPFLPKTYIDDLKRNLSPKEARRMLHGEWLSLMGDVIYYEYDPDVHFINKDYVPDVRYPVFWAHDFNIGENKPMSSCFFQYIGDTFHFFDEIVVSGARTLDACEEALDRKLLELANRYVVCGDAAGRARDTRSKGSDYDLINDFLQNVKVYTKHKARPQFIVEPAISNPPVRKRHNTFNAYLKNDHGHHRIKVYKKCKTLDKGLRLTKLKTGGSYVEDDSKPWQHITTAAGYGILKALSYNERKSSLIPR